MSLFLMTCQKENNLKTDFDNLTCKDMIELFSEQDPSYFPIKTCHCIDDAIETFGNAPHEITGENVDEIVDKCLGQHAFNSNLFEQGNIE